MSKSDIEADDDDFIIHPKKDAKTLGTLAAQSNSWYENELEDGSEYSEEDDGADDVKPMPTFPLMKVPLPTLATVPEVKGEMIKRKLVENPVDITESVFLNDDIEDLVTSAGGDTKLLNDIIEYGEKLAKAARLKLEALSVKKSKI